VESVKQGIKEASKRVVSHYLSLTIIDLQRQENALPPGTPVLHFSDGPIQTRPWHMWYLAQYRRQNRRFDGLTSATWVREEVSSLAEEDSAADSQRASDSPRVEAHCQSEGGPCASAIFTDHVRSREISRDLLLVPAKWSKLKRNSRPEIHGQKSQNTRRRDLHVLRLNVFLFFRNAYVQSGDNAHVKEECHLSQRRCH
jgi:hypothetical protein